jgi:hypothetical protein
VNASRAGSSRRGFSVPVPCRDQCAGRSQPAFGVARPLWADYTPGTACQRRRIGKRRGDRSKVDLRDPRTPIRYRHRLRKERSLTHRDQAISVLWPYVELLDRALFGAGRVRRIDQADESGRRRLEAADLPGRDPARTLIFTLTLTHNPNIERRGLESESVRFTLP